MIRIWADFNAQDEEGRVWLNTVGSLRDLGPYEGKLTEGMTILLHADDEFEVEATLVFDRIWLGVPNYETLRYLDEDED